MDHQPRPRGPSTAPARAPDGGLANASYPDPGPGPVPATIDTLSVHAPMSEHQRSDQSRSHTRKQRDRHAGSSAPPLLRRLVMGAVAGVTATAPQSAVVWGLRSAGLYQRKPAPEQVAAGVTGGATDDPVIPPLWRRTVKVGGHLGYGGAGGALYAITVPPQRYGAVSGVLAGLAIWAVSYLGWLPLTRIMPPPHKDERGRQLTMLLAHIAYGLALGNTARRLT